MGTSTGKEHQTWCLRQPISYFTVHMLYCEVVDHEILYTVMKSCAPAVSSGPRRISLLQSLHMFLFYYI